MNPLPSDPFADLVARLGVHRVVSMGGLRHRIGADGYAVWIPPPVNDRWFETDPEFNALVGVIPAWKDPKIVALVDELGIHEEKGGPIHPVYLEYTGSEPHVIALRWSRWYRLWRTILRVLRISRVGKCLSVTGERLCGWSAKR